MMSSNNNLTTNTLLTSTTVGDVVQQRAQKLIIIQSHDLIRDAYQTITEAEILSAPVYDEEAKKFIGMIDIKDFAAFIVDLHTKGGPIVFTTDKIVDFSGMDPFVPIPEDTNMHDTLKKFAESGVHRMPIVKKDDPQQVTNIITQSTILKWILENKSQLGDAADKTVGELESSLGGTSGLPHLMLCINEEDTLLTAFEKMRQYNVHAVGVLNKGGQLIGNISVTDSKYILEWDLDYLERTAKEFFQQLHKPRELVSCTKQTKFGDLITQITKSKVHRVYVVDEKNKPIDIVTLTNIIDTLWKLVSQSSLTA